MMSSEEFKCIFCKESFDDKETLQVHFRKHGDKNFHLNLKKSRPQDEPPQLPVKPASSSSNDQAEMVECDVCPEVFTSISKAITHKHKVHPDHDAKYFCPWCGKLFTMKHLYNKHIHTAHTTNEKLEKSFNCDACDVEFHLPVAMCYHNKFFHRIYEMPTIGNSKKLKMFNQEAVQIFYCPFCGEEYDNKINLHKHMADDHNDENQNPDDVLRCPVCDALFYHLDAYELHLTYHSVDDMYSERNPIMDEITDFSLESVPPLAEKVETLEPPGDEEATGIEQLFELTMDDTKHKKKKHKKHKKAKKSAITLGQFLNMNTDVFGEGLNFQGVEEVPSQTIAKRLKKPIKTPVQSKLRPDIEKLKRQGIVVKKKVEPKPVQPLIVKPNQSKIIQKIPKQISQNKPTVLATPNEVLTKLINQNNSQIKIVKKTGLETKITSEHTDDMKQDSPAPANEVPDKAEPSETKATPSTFQENTDIPEDNTTDDPGTDNDENITRKSPSPEKEIQKSIENGEEESNHSQSILEENESDVPQTIKEPSLADKLSIFRNNSSIVVKSSQQSVPDHNTNKEEEIPSHDLDENIAEHEDPVPDVNGESNKNDSLNVLKHLSHLIVKSCSQEKTPAKLDNTQVIDKKVEPPELSKIAHLIKNSPAKIVQNAGKVANVNAPHCNTPLKIKTVEPEASNFESDDESYEQNDKISTAPVQTDKLVSILNNPQLNIQAIKKSPKLMQQKESPVENMPKNEKSSTDLLKHLKNVTAKPIGLNKSVNTPTSSPKLSPKLISSIKKEPGIPPVKHDKVIQEDIEIFNIDDSDSDEANSNTAQTNKNKETPPPNKSTDVLRNINKNITIKSVNNKPHNKVISQVQMKELDSDDDGDKDESPNTPAPNARNPKFSSPPINQKQSALNNVLKNLSKNITVKSGNASPAHFAMPDDLKSPDSNFEPEDDDADSETDSLAGCVKITEMNDVSDEDLHKEDLKNDLHDNVKVEYPDEDSDNEEKNANEVFDDNFSDEDLEAHIPANTVKSNQKPIPNIDSLKNVCKDLVIKPSGSAMNRTSQPPSSDEIPPFAKSLSNRISLKNIKQDSALAKSSNANFRNADQFVGQSINKSVINKMASSSNKVNTVNKEVKTIKTFQSQTQTQTVIEEITTTVTKTVKTVNQSMKQEMRNTGQSSSMPQKIQHLNASNKHFQGVKVRQATPTAPTGPRIRNPGMRPTRPVLPAPIRPNNQLVPVRPRLNPPRLNNPRMPIVRPSTSSQPRPQIAKLAPGVGPANAKRPNTEAPGHFSCFKKTKESLFPEGELGAINKHDGNVQFSSTMQMSKSNFTSTTKTVKGNSVMTATQMKSEMSASSQQLGKLRNLSGLSVIKTSQANQMHVEEKSEISTAKQNTLDAIQRLQSQGLLVKKPRLVSEESEHSNPGSDVNNFSDEEYDT